jgi:hypothetical protein
LRKLEIDQIIKVTITVLDDAIVSGENLLTYRGGTPYQGGTTTLAI